MQLTCAKVLRELSNHIDEDVTPTLRQRIDAHVRMCGGCRAIFDGVRNVITLVGEFETIELPRGFSERLRQSSPEPECNSSFTSPSLRCKLSA